MKHKDVIADALICTDHTSNISDHIYSTNLQNTTERDSRDFFLVFHRILEYKQKCNNVQDPHPVYT